MEKNGFSCEVLIVGGGPAGLLLSAELALLGVDVVVVERNAAPVDQPRAGTIHARTIQTLLRRGLIEAEDGGDPSKLREQEFPFAAMPGMIVSTPETEGPAVMKIPQIKLEQRFEAHAKTCGARILREHTLLSFDEQEDSVEAEIDGPEGRFKISARYVVGADGARSTVRDLGGFDSVSHLPSVAALIVRAKVDNFKDVPNGWQRFDHGWTRVEADDISPGRIMTISFDGPENERHRPVTLDEFATEFERLSGGPITLSEADFLGRYSDYSRLATQYRRGRLFLVGDAAHVHFPIGGQGLNLGILDVINLGWKLAAVLGGGDPELLDSYHDERHPAAQSVLDNTRAQAIVMRPEAEYDPLRKLFQTMIQDRPTNDFLAGMISAQNLTYGPDGAFQTNMRLEVNGETTSLARLLHTPKPVLVLLEGAAPDIESSVSRWKDRIQIVKASAPYPPAWAAALIRPDGYRAWSSETGTETPSDILRKWFG